MCILCIHTRDVLFFSRQTNTLLHHIIIIISSNNERQRKYFGEASVKSHSRQSLQMNAVQVNTHKEHPDNLIYTIRRVEGKAEEGFKDSTGPF